MMKKSASRILIFVTLLMMICTISAFAEGSQTLNGNGGNRAYTEWDASNYTASINRVTRLNVYAKAGETIYLGSSVYESQYDEDILLITPDETKIQLDVLKNGKGLIDTYNKEQAGPNVNGKTDGYTPLSYKVTQTGIYTVEFHSPIKTKQVAAKVAKTEEIYTGNEQGSSVAAWDISVFDQDSHEITGRVFASYLALNMGNSGCVFNGNVYILTKDGYIYNMKMNGMDPYGFIMYANNRGLIDGTSQMSLYKNGIAKDNEMTSMLGNVIAPRPDLPDNDKSYTHYIFFKKPSADLPASMPTTPDEVAQIVNFSFEGSEGSTGTVGSGGYFKVEFNKKTTYKLTIDTNNDGIFDETDVNISDAASIGINKIYWNGKDQEGNDIPAGNYNAKIFTKGGEYHFQLIDVETSANGISIQLMNDDRITGDDAYTVYYDNTSYTTANGTFVNTNYQNANGIKPAYGLSGVNSKEGVYKYTSKFGDMKAFDVWTYTLGRDSSTSLSLVDGITTGTISGNVFFDSDKDSLFGANEAGMAGVNVTITCEDGTVIETVTDNAGKYAATIPLGKYTVSVEGALNHVLTSSSNTFSGELTKTALNSFIDSVGYYCNKDVAINVSTDKEELTVGDSLSYTVELANKTQFTIAGIKASVIIPKNTTYLSDTSNGLFDYESGAISVSELKAGEKINFTINVKAEASGSYKVIGNANCDADSDGTNNKSYAIYTVVEEPKANVPSYVIPTGLSNNFAYIFGYNNIEMAPENDMTVGECCAVIYRLLKQNNMLGSYKYDINSKPVYPEFAGRWDRSATEYMIYKGIYSADMPIFGLDRPILRKDAFKMFAIALGFTNDTSLTYEQYALILNDAGFVVGNGNGDFNLNGSIHRAEVCKIYNMIIGRDLMPLEDKDGNKVTPETYGFEDMTNSKAWYYSVILKATSAYENGFVDVEKRGIRNKLDDYE